MDLPGTTSSSSTPLLDAARQLTSELPSDLDAADRVLLVMIEQLATTIDGAARFGKALVAAMAARELREAIAHLQERHAAGGPDPEADFQLFADFLRDSITGSS